MVSMHFYLLFILLIKLCNILHISVLNRGEFREKFFFFDIDGTLRSRVHDNYSDSTLEALHLLRKNGHLSLWLPDVFKTMQKRLQKNLRWSLLSPTEVMLLP